MPLSWISSTTNSAKVTEKNFSEKFCLSAIDKFHEKKTWMLGEWKMVGKKQEVEY